MVNAESVALPLGPMPTAVTNQQGAANVPYRPRHSDAFTHQPFIHLLGQMNSTLLLQSTEAGVTATQIANIRTTGMPVADRGITLFKQWVLGKTVVLHVVVHIALGPLEQGAQ